MSDLQYFNNSEYVCSENLKTFRNFVTIWRIWRSFFLDKFLLVNRLFFNFAEEDNTTRNAGIMKQPITDFIKGQPIRNIDFGTSTSNSYRFSAVRISRSDNIVFPDRLIIDDEKVVFYKGKLIGYDSTTIARENIGGVSIKAEILFADIFIDTTGGQRVVAEGFSKHDAKTIQKLLSR